MNKRAHQGVIMNKRAHQGVIMNKRARLDADRSAKPLTTLVKQIRIHPFVTYTPAYAPAESMSLHNEDTGESISVLGKRHD